MGGFGSGRQGGKDCTGDMRPVDVRHLQRDGSLKPGQSYGLQWKRGGNVVASINLAVQADYVRFTYRHSRHGGEWQDVQAVAYLDRMPCRFGGSRAWWLCPCCGRRVAILYIGKTPACRHCYRLAYRSEREDAGDRASRQADKLRDRLGWEPGILNGNGGKPKGMHWRTFERLQAQHDAYASVFMAGIGLMLGKLQQRTESLQRRMKAR